MEGNFVLSDVEEQLSEQVSLESLLDEHLVDGFAAFDGFHNRSDAVDDVVPGLYEQGKTPLILILDKITDVRNIGAIARSAECAGVDAIVLPLKGGAQLNEDAVKSSAGALHKIPICRHSNLVEVIQFLKDSGIQVMGVTEKAEHYHFESDFTQPLCLIMGNEYEGIAREYLQECNDAVKIPMVGTIASLNVSVATGIVLFEVVKQRHFHK